MFKFILAKNLSIQFSNHGKIYDLILEDLEDSLTSKKCIFFNIRKRRF